MVKATFSANLARIVSKAVSKEETRYYLGGVHIEPHPVAGVVFVATDGHRLLCAHDPAGYADGTAILKLSPANWKLCAEPKGKASASRTRSIQIDGATAKIVEHNIDGEESAETIGIQENALIDGTFPDWRRALPNFKTDGDGKLIVHCDTFNGRYLADFGNVGKELAEITDTSMMSVFSPDVGAPALVRWTTHENIFGVIMPLRGGLKSPVYPEFLNAKPAEQAVAS